MKLIAVKNHERCLAIGLETGFCERGAIPPFGSVYHVHTLVDESLADDEEIVFQAETHDESIRMTYHDFEIVEHPLRGDFTYHISMT